MKYILVALTASLLTLTASLSFAGDREPDATYLLTYKTTNVLKSFREKPLQEFAKKLDRITVLIEQVSKSQNVGVSCWVSTFAAETLRFQGNDVVIDGETYCFGKDPLLLNIKVVEEALSKDESVNTTFRVPPGGGATVSN